MDAERQVFQDFAGDRVAPQKQGVGSEQHHRPRRHRDDGSAQAIQPRAARDAQHIHQRARNSGPHIDIEAVGQKAHPFPEGAGERAEQDRKHDRPEQQRFESARADAPEQIPSGDRCNDDENQSIERNERQRAAGDAPGGFRGPLLHPRPPEIDDRNGEAHRDDRNAGEIDLLKQREDAHSADAQRERDDFDPNQSGDEPGEAQGAAPRHARFGGAAHAGALLDFAVMSGV